MSEYIYVLGMDGRPQMPTTRKRHMDKLLHTGKAKVVDRASAATMTREMPGAEFIHENRRYILSGQLTNGKYYRSVGSTQNFPAAKCRIRRHNRGLIFVS